MRLALRGVRGALLGAGLLAGAAQAASPAPDCATLSFAEGAFSACFPAPVPVLKRLAGPGGSVRLWSAGTKAGFYLAIDAPRPAAAPQFVALLVSALDGTLVAQKQGAVAPAAGPPAQRFWFSLADGRSGEGVLAPVGDRAYGLLAVTGRKDAIASARFLGSLAIPASAKAGEALEAARGAPAPASPQAEALAARVAEVFLRAASGAAARADNAPPPAPPLRQSRPLALADTPGTDNIPDPHADLRGERSGAAELDAPVDPTRAAPMPAQAPRTSAMRPPLAEPSFPPPPHWTWHPAGWRWTGYRWEMQPGWWERTGD